MPHGTGHSISWLVISLLTIVTGANAIAIGELPLRSSSRSPVTSFAQLTAGQRQPVVSPNTTTTITTSSNNNNNQQSNRSHDQDPKRSLVDSKDGELSSLNDSRDAEAEDEQWSGRLSAAVDQKPLPVDHQQQSENRNQNGDSLDLNGGRRRLTNGFAGSAVSISPREDELNFIVLAQRQQTSAAVSIQTSANSTPLAHGHQNIDPSPTSSQKSTATPTAITAATTAAGGYPMLTEGSPPLATATDDTDLNQFNVRGNSATGSTGAGNEKTTPTDEQLMVHAAEPIDGQPMGRNFNVNLEARLKARELSVPILCLNATDFGGTICNKTSDQFTTTRELHLGAKIALATLSVMICLVGSATFVDLNLTAEQTKDTHQSRRSGRSYHHHHHHHHHMNVDQGPRDERSASLSSSSWSNSYPSINSICSASSPILPRWTGKRTANINQTLDCPQPEARQTAERTNSKVQLCSTEQSSANFDIPLDSESQKRADSFINAALRAYNLTSAGQRRPVDHSHEQLEGLSAGAEPTSGSKPRSASKELCLQLLLAFSLCRSARFIFQTDESTEYSSSSDMNASSHPLSRGKREIGAWQRLSPDCARATSQAAGHRSRLSSLSSVNGAQLTTKQATERHSPDLEEATTNQRPPSAGESCHCADVTGSQQTGHLNQTESQCRKSVDSLHGLRFLSMIWIIVIHSYSFALRWLFFADSAQLDYIYKTAASQLLANGTFACDSFFFAGGFLLPYLAFPAKTSQSDCLSKIDKKQQNHERKLNTNEFTFDRILGNLLHRYIRMMPLMMAIIGLSATLLRYLGEGPNWDNSTLMFDKWCRKNWWINAMFLHNFLNRENMCLGHSWYSAVDIQLFLMGQVILYILFRSKLLGILLCCACLIGAQLITGALTLAHNLPAVPLIASVSEQSMNLYYGEIYIKPYCRASPYLIGILLAYLMRTTSLGQIKLKKWHVITGWTASIGTLVAILMAMQPAMNGQVPSELQSALYSALSRPLWACATGWMIFACMTRHGGIFATILSAKCFIPFSRLTYPAFLIHPIVMAIFYGSRQSSFHFSHYLMLYLTLGNIVITYIVAFLLSALFELPLLSIEGTLKRTLASA